MTQQAARLVRRVEVPETDRIAATADYATAFAVEVGNEDERTPEQWARLIFEGAPTALRWFVTIGWRFVLGLRLGPTRSPEYVLGWRIVGRAAQAITLRAESKLIVAHKVVLAANARVTVTTSVRYERRSGRLVWTAVSPVHHRTEPLLLSRAAAHGPASAERT